MIDLWESNKLMEENWWMIASECSSWVDKIRIMSELLDAPGEVDLECLGNLVGDDDCDVRWLAIRLALQAERSVVVDRLSGFDGWRNRLLLESFRLGALEQDVDISTEMRQLFAKLPTGGVQLRSFYHLRRHGAGPAFDNGDALGILESHVHGTGLQLAVLSALRSEQAVDAFKLDELCHDKTPAFRSLANARFGYGQSVLDELSNLVVDDRLESEEVVAAVGEIGVLAFQESGGLDLESPAGEALVAVLNRNSSLEQVDAVLAVLADCLMGTIPPLIGEDDFELHWMIENLAKSSSREVTESYSESDAEAAELLRLAAVRCLGRADLSTDNGDEVIATLSNVCDEDEPALKLAALEALVQAEDRIEDDSRGEYDYGPGLALICSLVDGEQPVIVDRALREIGSYSADFLASRLELLSSTHQCCERPEAKAEIRRILAETDSPNALPLDVVIEEIREFLDMPPASNGRDQCRTRCVRMLALTLAHGDQSRPAFEAKDLRALAESLTPLFPSELLPGDFFWAVFESGRDGAVRANACITLLEDAQDLSCYRRIAAAILAGPNDVASLLDELVCLPLADTLGGPDDLELLGQMAHGSGGASRSRKLAIERLGELDCSASLPILRQALERIRVDDSSAGRELIEALLHRQADPAAFSILADVHRSADQGLRKELDDKLQLPSVDLVHEKNWLSALAGVATQEAHGESLRLRVIHLLGKLDDNRSLGVLLELAKPLAAASCFEAVVDALAQRSELRAFVAVRDAILGCPDLACIAKLRDSIELPGREAVEEDEFVSAIEPLAASSRSTPRLQVKTIVALGSIRSSKSRAILLRLLRGKEVRGEAEQELISQLLEDGAQTDVFRQILVCVWGAGSIHRDEVESRLKLPWSDPKDADRAFLLEILDKAENDGLRKEAIECLGAGFDLKPSRFETNSIRDDQLEAQVVMALRDVASHGAGTARNASLGWIGDNNDILEKAGAIELLHDDRIGAKGLELLEKLARNAEVAERERKGALVLLYAAGCPMSEQEQDPIRKAFSRVALDDDGSVGRFAKHFLRTLPNTEGLRNQRSADLLSILINHTIEASWFDVKQGLIRLDRIDERIQPGVVRTIAQTLCDMASGSLSDAPDDRLGRVVVGIPDNAHTARTILERFEAQEAVSVPMGAWQVTGINHEAVLYGDTVDKYVHRFIQLLKQQPIDDKDLRTSILASVMGLRVGDRTVIEVRARIQGRPFTFDGEPARTRFGSHRS